MKLWIKSTVALASLTVASGAVIGGVYWYNKDAKAANGQGYSTSLPLSNQSLPDINGKTEEDIKSLLDIHFFNASDVITSNIGQYDASKNTVNGQPYETWRKSYDDKNGQPPSLVAFFGTAAFTNEYLDAVSPEDFSNYVAWFIKNVPWSGDLGSLERFNIKRGIQQDGTAIILGAHENQNKERQEINFFPDAFFGSLPGYSIQSGRGQKVDNLLIKLSNQNNQLLRKSEIEALIANKSKIEDSIGKEFKIRYIKPVEKINSVDASGKEIKDSLGKNVQEMGYEVYIDAYAGAKGTSEGNLIDSVAKKYPYLLQEVSGLHLDANGKLVDGKYRTITTTSRVPFIGALSVSSPNFHSVGINWLKYVGAHEYGHHTTLQMGQDASEDYVYSGAFSSMSGLQPGTLYSRQMQNLYLLARSHHLSIDKTSIDGSVKSTGNEFISFLHDGTPETSKQIYGSDKTDDQGVADAIQALERRAGQTFKGLEDVAAKDSHLDLFDLFIENSWDHRSGTLNPSVATSADNSQALVYKDGKLVPIAANYNDLIKDAAGNIIHIDSADTEPVIQTWGPNGAPVKFNDKGEIIVPAGKDVDHDRVTVVYKSATEKVVADNAPAADVLHVSKQVDGILAQLLLKYSLNGWDGDATVVLGQNAVAQSGTFKGVPYSLSQLNQGGISTANIFYGLWDSTDATGTAKPGLISKLTAAAGQSPFVNIETAGKSFSDLLQDPAFRLGLVFNNDFYGGLGSNFLGVPTEAQVEANAKNIAIKSIGNTLTSSMLTSQLKSAGLPDAQVPDVVKLLLSTPFDQYPAQLDAFKTIVQQIIATANQQAEIIVNAALSTSQNDLNDIKTKAAAGDQQAQLIVTGLQALEDGLKQAKLSISNAETLFGIGTMITTQSGGRYSFLPNGSFTTAENATIMGQLVNNIYDYNSAAQTHNAPLKLVTSYKGEDTLVYLVMDSKGHKIAGAVGIGMQTLTKTTFAANANGQLLDPADASGATTLSVHSQIAPDGLAQKLAAAAKAFEMKVGADPLKLLNQSLDGIDSLDKFLDTFNVDPLNDFEMVTVDGTHKVTVLKNAVLAKWFDIDAFKRENRAWNDEMAQQVLTKAIFDSNYLVIKDTNIDLDAAASNQSLFALLSVASDSKTFNSDQVVIPRNFQFAAIQNAKLTDLSKITDAIKAYKALDPKRGGNTVSFVELSMYLGQQRYASPMYAGSNVLGITQAVIGPSSDVLEALQVRMEDKFGEKFSGYTFDPAEAINRDWLQITYMPDSTNLENLPSFVSGVSESSTGFEYFVDGTSTSVFEKGLVDVKVLAATIDALAKTNPAWTGLAAIGSTTGTGLAAFAINSLSSSYFGRSTSTTNGFFKDDYLRRVTGNPLYYNAEDEKADATHVSGKSVEDHEIRIRDFVKDANGQYPLVTDRVRATWVWAMKSHGVGSRTVSGLWRSPDRDASYMFGYVPTQAHVNGQVVNSKEAIKYVRFTDTTTGETKLLPIKVGADNLHYYEDRIQHGSTFGTIHTLEQDGFTSWESDFAVIGGYRDALLASGHDYKAEFVDVNGNVIQDENGKSLFTMGDTTKGTDSFAVAGQPDEQVNTGRTYICENGKPFGQASTYFEQVLATTKQTVFRGQDVQEGDSILHVNNQFNG